MKWFLDLTMRGKLFVSFGRCSTKCNGEAPTNDRQSFRRGFSEKGRIAR